MGLHLALAMVFPAKGKASPEAKFQPTKRKADAKSDVAPVSGSGPTGRWDFSRLFNVAAHPEVVKDARQSAEKIRSITRSTVHLMAETAQKETYGFVPKPMTHEEVRLWLQSFNAGPYACLKYKGDVPYRETQNYVPRVMKNYERVSQTPYDAHIAKSARKYGLDPQMIRAIMKTESDFQNTCVSHAGARGLMQVMPVVWSEMEKRYEFGWKYTSGVFEPEKNIEVACAYLAWLRYDFLPRHFQAYEKDPSAPVVLKRDKDRGVPDRPTPRIIAKSAGGPADEAVVEVASVAEPKVIEQADKKEPAVSSTEAIGKVAISSPKSEGVVKSSAGNGKKRVVVRGGKNNAITINFTSNDKSAGKRGTEVTESRKPAAASPRDDETQGG